MRSRSWESRTLRKISPLLITERPGQSGPNPFESELALANSAYLAVQEDRLVRVSDPDKPPSACQVGVHQALRAFIASADYSCVGAKAAFNSGTYRLGIYGDMGGSAALAGLARDLFTFTREQPAIGGDFTTFVASFAGPDVASEEQFETLLWDTLQSLYDVDRLFNPPDPAVAEDPEAGNFGFSFAGRGFFVIGLHPASSRLARRFPYPTLVFNAHFQFDKLKADGRYPKMQKAIRTREMGWQGSLNPNLSDFGASSEARQYAGRAVEDDWKCPLHLHGQKRG